MTAAGLKLGKVEGEDEAHDHRDGQKRREGETAVGTGEKWRVGRELHRTD